MPSASAAHVRTMSAAQFVRRSREDSESPGSVVSACSPPPTGCGLVRGGDDDANDAAPKPPMLCMTRVATMW